MNSLSWLIYIIGMVEPLKAFLLSISLGCACAYALTYMCQASSCSDIYDYMKNAEAMKENIRNSFRKYRKILVPLFLFSSILYVVVPSKDTMVLIAASEIGQRVITSEQVQSALSPSAQLIQTWIKNETEKLQAQIAKRNAPQQ